VSARTRGLSADKGERVSFCDFVRTSFMDGPSFENNLMIFLLVRAVHKRRPHRIAKNWFPLVRTGSTSCPCGHTINFKKSVLFCTKKCWRPHLKNPLPPLSEKCPNWTNPSSPCPHWTKPPLSDCGHLLWTPWTASNINRYKDPPVVKPLIFATPKLKLLITTEPDFEFS